ncbi:MAG: MutS-related protein, partial [Myxococcaceae bacterium]
MTAPLPLEPTQQAPWQAYASRLEQSKRELAVLDTRSARIANARAAVFVIALAFAGLTVFAQLPSWGWALAAAFLGGFFVLASWHDRVFAAERRARLKVELNERGLARLCGQWRGFANKGDRFADPGHLYTPDLDVFGQGSLFQLLDETATKGGEEELARWLSAPAPHAAASERQGAVSELAPLLDFRQALASE